MHDADLSTPVTTIELGPYARVIVLRGRIGDDDADELRDQFLSALDGGVQGVLVDLSEAESLSISAHEIVRAASLTLEDRGGALLAWRWNGSVDEPAYVLSELRDHGVAGLVAVEPDRGGRGRA